jgi:pyruvyltransferase
MKVKIVFFIKAVKKVFRTLIFIYELFRIKFLKLLSSNYLPVAYAFNRYRWNIGDNINEFLFNSLFYPRKTIRVNPLNPFYSNLRIMGIGSIMDSANVENSIVFGSGFIESGSNYNGVPNKIFAVRGESTYDQIPIKHLNSNIILGDFGLLISHFIFPSKQEKFDVGIIPHYVDKKSIKLIELIEELRFKGLSITVLDVQSKDINEFFVHLVSCKKVISSSLHGLIFADSFNIPNLWIKFGDEIKGNDYKFYDYFSSVKRSNSDYSIEEFIEYGNEIFDKYSSNIDNKKRELLKTTELLKSYCIESRL